MADKHYNAEYLTDTVKILGQLKYRSYRYFEDALQNSVIIDLGCGTGQDVVNMADYLDKRAFKFVGVDHDPNMIKTREEALTLRENVSFLLSDALTLPFVEGSVGGVRMERLVQHIDTPLVLFEELYRILDDKGIVVVMESDWNSLSFYNGDQNVADKLNDFLVYRKVKNGRAAQELTSYFIESGFKGITMEVHPFVLTSYAEACEYLWIEKMIGEMLALQLINQKEHDQFIEAQKRADEQGFFSCTMNIVIVSATK